MDDGILCTLDELTGLVEQALSVDYPGAPTGRVRDVPDQRVIRWYVTKGLVDRPAANRGRVALYGRRHLLQLVAVKRRQAEGASLAEIQAELAGATDDALARVARLPAIAPDRPADATPDQPTDAAPSRTRFWTDRPARTAGTAPRRTAGAATDEPDGIALKGIRLAPGITLLIEDGAAPPTDAAAIRAAARPLLDLLAAGGHAVLRDDRTRSAAACDVNIAGQSHHPDEELNQ